MTIRDIDLKASDLRAGAEYRTSDGKHVVLEGVNILDDRPRVDITNAAKGDTLVLRNGRKYVCTGEVAGEGEDRAWQAGSHWFWFDGTCRPLSSKMDVVELIKAKDPVVSLEGLRIHEQFRVRSGEVFTCTRITSGGAPIFAVGTEHTLGLHFRYDGRSNLGFFNLEVVERLPYSSVLGRIREAINDIGKEAIDKVIVGNGLWQRAELEAGVKGKSGPESWIYVDGVRVWYNPTTYEDNECHVVLKLR